MALTHLSLFSGIGGLDLAAEWGGFITVGQCEYADFPTKILEQHWPDVPRWRDIRTLNEEDFYNRTGLRTVDVISGGFPCQPFSQAGKRRSENDDRYLWPEMLRVIRDISPAWVLGENVPGIVNLALDKVLSDLEDAGYETQTFIVPACGVDAPHKRERVAIVAHAIDGGCAMRRHRQLQDADRFEGRRNHHGAGAPPTLTGQRREDESRLSRMADGVRTEVYGTDTHAHIDGLQGRRVNTGMETAFTNRSCRERERERRGYDGNLRSLAEQTPYGKIGHLNPTWVEWLMGFPTGWTELRHSETP